MKKSVDINIEIIVGATIAILVKGFPDFHFGPGPEQGFMYRHSDELVFGAARRWQVIPYQAFIIFIFTIRYFILKKM